ncbi:MAG: signal peptidase I [Chloroflexi bacterium]|nr:signal peptidase I [Chloroflexota bacterium]
MTPYQRRWLKLIGASLSLILTVGLWWFFAPGQFGGQTTYLIINGNSMSPLLQSGDLVIVRANSFYQIGDVVAYRHPDVGAIIHRIVERDGDAFILQGDHNTWLDSYQPTTQEVLGKLWWHLPNAGTWIKYLRSPLVIAFIAALIGFLFMSSFLSTSPRTARLSPQLQGALKEITLVGLVAIFVGTMIFAVFAFTQPSTVTIQSEVPYKQSGVFEYSAAAPVGLFDGEAAFTGMPVFSEIMGPLTFNFTYHFGATQPVQMNGSYRVIAEVSDVSGWRRTWVLQPNTTFRGNQFVTHFTVDVNQVLVMTNDFESLTALTRRQYTVRVMPQVTVDGQVGESPLSESFAPVLTFQLDGTHLRLIKNDPKTPDTLHPVKEGNVTLMHDEPNRISFFGWGIDVEMAQMAAIVLLSGLLSTLMIVAALVMTSPLNESQRIAWKYAPLLVELHQTHEPPANVIGLQTMDDLGKVAHTHNLMIWHTKGENDHYYVKRDEIIYHYQTKKAGT